MKSILVCCALLMSAVICQAQLSTETFETESASSIVFTDNGQIFVITSQFGGVFRIYYDARQFGWNGIAKDFRAVDNSGSTIINGGGVGLTIECAVPFKVAGFWVYVSKANLTQLGVGGSLTATGKLAGATVFTATSSTGFNTDTGVANGHTHIDLATFGGSNNANKTIDELVITTGGNFEYLNLDAFRWEKIVPLPVGLVDFKGAHRNGSNSLTWNTSDEKNVRHFSVERSDDGHSFAAVGAINSKGAGNHSYSFTEKAGNAAKTFYRLHIVDNDGASSFSSVVSLSNEAARSVIVSPNPFTDFLDLSVSASDIGKSIYIYDANGRIVRTETLSDLFTKLKVGDLAAGVYFLKLPNGESLRIVKK